MIEQIFSGGRLLAIVISHNHHAPGVNFITPYNLSQQVVFIQNPPKIIDPHRHSTASREVLYT